MGAQGSGTWYRWSRQRTVDDMKALDIRELAKSAGLLNKSFPVMWERSGDQTGSVDVQTSRDSVQLNYLLGPRRHHQTISINYTSCNYGRQRPWFSCPGCGRRCAKLYLGGSGFFCRLCYKLLYRSQTASKLDRLIRQRTDLEACMYDESGWFKRGMHCKTRGRLMDRYMELEGKILKEL